MKWRILYNEEEKREGYQGVEHQFAQLTVITVILLTFVDQEKVMTEERIEK